MACPRCGHSNTLRVKDCARCNAPLPPAFGATSAAAAGERRQLTVLFADLEDSARLAESVEVEVLHEILAQYHASCGAVIEQSGGYVAQVLGDGILAYFGFPEAHEDNAIRAIRAGLAIQGELERLNAEGSHRLRARVGVHTGPVVIGELGSGRRREVLAVGETVNLAARVQNAARQGTVVVTAATRDLVESYYELAPLGVHTLKGVSSPVALHEVVGERPAHQRMDFEDRESLSPFVGRSVELRLLTDAWEAVQQGHGQILLLVGEAGVGKSRHTLEFRRLAAGVPHELLLGSCSPYHRDTALHPVIAAMARWLRIEPTTPATERLALLKASLPNPSDGTVLALLEGLLSIPPEIADPLPPYGPQKMRERTLDAVREWLAARARERRVLFVVEDIHWADPTTLELLRRCAPEALPGTLVVLTSRPTLSAEWQDGQVPTLHLERLKDSEIAQILEHLGARYALPPEIAREIAERSEGIPLFAEELCRSAGAMGETLSNGEPPSNAPGSRSALPLPATLQESVSARLDQLGKHKEVAQLASVLGREFTLGVLQAIHASVAGVGAADVGAAVDAMQRVSLVARGGGDLYNFRHSLLQEATYRSFGKSTRVHYHQHVARVLSARYPDSFGAEPEVLARHFAQGELNREAAQQYGAAGARALVRSAYTEAATQFSRALECTHALPESAVRDRHEVDLRAGLGFSLLVTKGFGASEVEAVYRQGLQLAERLQDVPLRILYGIWAFHMLRGDTTETARLVPLYRRILDTSDNPLELLVSNAALGTRAYYRGRYAEAIGLLSRATELCDRENPGAQSAMLMRHYNFEGLLYAPVFLSWCHLFAGRVSEATAGRESFLALAEKSGDPYLLSCGLGCAGPMLRDLQDVDGAAALGGRLLAIALENGFPHWIASALCINGWAAAQKDPQGPGVEMLKQGLGLFKMIGSLLIYPYYLSFLVEVHILGGRPADALPLADEALRIAEDGLDIVYAPEMRRLRGEALAALGNVVAAEDEFRLAAATTRAQGAHLLALRATLSLAQLLERQGRVSEAVPLLAAAAAALTDPVELPEVRRARDWVARHQH
jgi:class 3 adenylate cyclase/tetratricopeptide (TPR) repeat protein